MDNNQTKNLVKALSCIAALKPLTTPDRLAAFRRSSELADQTRKVRADADLRVAELQLKAVTAAEDEIAAMAGRHVLSAFIAWNAMGCPKRDPVGSQPMRVMEKETPPHFRGRPRPGL
jgi:hypothetical protein